MDAAFVEGLVRLFERSSLAELEYTEAGGDRVRLARAPGATPALAPPSVTQATPPAAPGPAPSAGPATLTIAASFHGVFYRGPGPGQTPFVQDGDTVEEGQTLAILEAMKVLNRVEADAPGRIVAVLAADGDAVAAGTPLFTLEPVA